MSSQQSSNQLCIIDGDYDVAYSDDLDANKSPNKLAKDKLDKLIESYMAKLNLNNENQIYSFSLLHSKDGSELYLNFLQSFGLNTSDLDNNVGGDVKTTQLQRTNNSHNNSSSFICFLISDFDQNDKVFIKLEEIQLKLANILNSLSLQPANNNGNDTMANSALANARALSSQKKQFMIFGWPVVYYCLENNLPLTSAVDVERPLYCKLMSGCFVCFTGFRKENKHTVAYCIKLVHYMGGSVRKEYNKKITHLIVKSTLSTKYKTAYNIGRCQLLTEDWIVDSWKHRNQVGFNVNDEEFLKKFKLKALYSLSIAFYGFTPEETQHMKDVTIENGGTPISDLNDPLCTHIVINDQEVKQLNEDESNVQITPTTKSSSHIIFNPNISPFSNTRASIVKAEWFWASIQICCRASECLYEFTKPKSENFKPNMDPPTKRIKLSVDNLLSQETLNSTSANNLSCTDSPHNHHHNQKHSANTPTYHSANNQSTSSISNSNQNRSSNNLLNDCNSPTLANINSRLSTGDRLCNRTNMSNNNLSTSASLLDATTDDAMSIDSPFEKQRDNSHGLLNSASSNGTNGAKKMNKRSQRIYELFETEKRFVNILHTIIVYFKDPIEAPDQVAGPILDQTELKEIFGNLPPIYEVHCKIKDRLERLANRINLNFNDDAGCVGDIYLDNADALLKTYPPFVNFYEKTKEMIVNCDKTKPRFHAFLKITQSKPECGRQTLIDLFIRPVQRLPSTLLLLDDILKETPKTHRDYELLSKAIASLKEVMTHINEFKRKTECHQTMFAIINDIENCPATVLSSHRSFLKKIDVYESSNELLKKGAQLTLFLFSDCLLICKPRLKLINASKSPNAVSKQRTPQKCYKHISLFSLNNITKVCDILQNNDDTDLFGILCRLAGEKDKFYSFKVIPSTTAATSSSNTSTLNTTTTSGPTNYAAYCSTISSTSSASSSSTYSSIYASTTNLNFFDEHYQAQVEKKEYIKLLAMGICNVKCITEYENILCTIEAKQLQIDLNESGGSKKLDAMKSFTRRVSRAFSFNDTPNKIKKTLSSVFRSPFQSSYSQQSLNEQKASRLTSLASLQLTPTLLENKRKFCNLTFQKSRDTLVHPFFKSNINIQTTSSLLSLDCVTSEENCSNSSVSSSTKMNSLNEQTLNSDDEGFKKMPDITNMIQTSSIKRQFS